MPFSASQKFAPKMQIIVMSRSRASEMLLLSDTVCTRTDTTNMDKFLHSDNRADSGQKNIFQRLPVGYITLSEVYRYLPQDGCSKLALVPDVPLA